MGDHPDAEFFNFGPATGDPPNQKLIPKVHADEIRAHGVLLGTARYRRYVARAVWHLVNVYLRYAETNSLEMFAVFPLILEAHELEAYLAPLGRMLERIDEEGGDAEAILRRSFHAGIRNVGEAYARREIDATAAADQLGKPAVGLRIVLELTDGES